MHVIVEIELVIEVESQVVQNRYRENDRASYERKIDERVGRMSSSCKVEEFSFAVLHNKANIKENFGHDIVATK